MKLIGLLLLLGLASVVEGEVVVSFLSSCPDFFIKDQNDNPVTPTVLSPESRYKQICQKYKGKRSSLNQDWSLMRTNRSTLFQLFDTHSHTDTDKSNKSTGYRYATLYDNDNRIPVYSAYLYTDYALTNRTTPWMIEPQLDGHSQEEMTTEENVDGQLGTNQALNGDYLYRDKGYERGHLYPRCQNCDQDQVESTFTLTNAAPQTAQDSKRWYDQVEKKIAQRMSDKCSERTAFVVTGVVPGGKYLGRFSFLFMNDHGVVVASHFWSAFCCKDKYDQNTLISEGYILEMKGDGSAEAVNQTLNQLNHDLAIKYSSSNFQVFGSIQGCS
ncbi:uncharacterized protein LOC134070202 [Sardina pilchardus]|uniref:uncharacterized protein LOC134070202 n=1 Tax=Sardina pilchardus TaxID=27697 RepID=UPI002E1050F4